MTVTIIILHVDLTDLFLAVDIVLVYVPLMLYQQYPHYSSPDGQARSSLHSR